MTTMLDWQSFERSVSWTIFGCVLAALGLLLLMAAVFRDWVKTRNK